MIQTSWVQSAFDASTVLQGVRRVQARTRLYGNGHWFASVVFGVVILGALPFYIQSSRPIRSGPPLLGRAFEGWSPHSWTDKWSTFYWAVAIVLGFAAVVAYYRLRARRLGVQGRLSPAVVVGLLILGLVMWVNAGSPLWPGNFGMQGTAALVVIAIGLLVLSGFERSRPFCVFAAGFLGLAVLACLYDVVNLFQRLGIGRPFSGVDHVLPNLILPGAYLFIGGLIFLVCRGKLPHQVYSTDTMP